MPTCPYCNEEMIEDIVPGDFVCDNCEVVIPEHELDKTS